MSQPPIDPPVPQLHAVIMAGGLGTRFWPLSRELRPKQLLDVFGGASLIAQAIERAGRITGAGRVHVLTSDRLRFEIENHLAAHTCEATVLAEPSARNTAPAFALGAAYVASLDPDALVAILPSDHLIAEGPEWERAMRAAVQAAREGWLVTIGLTPTRPETGFGYILSGEPLDRDVGARAVERFVEKPDAQRAAAYVADGRYLWNSGMLVAPARLVLDELEAAGMVETAHVAKDLAALARHEWNTPEAREAFDALDAVPFDTAVLEVSKRVAVVSASFSWSDVGSLGALGMLGEADAAGNVFTGDVIDIDSRDTVVYSTDRLVATLGLSDTIVVDTADATLVAAAERAGDVRLIVDALAEAGRREVVESRTTTRPWGSWTVLVRGAGFQVKTIEVKPGTRLSLQSHEKRSEHWVVVAGSARVEIDGESFELAPNESAYVPAGATHRLANPGDEVLRIVEVAVGEYLGEDDITRYEDDWARGRS